MIFVPLALGQAFAFAAYREFSLASFFHALLFGVLYQVYLLYRNDVADEAVDHANGRYFLSGGSRVLPEGKLERADLVSGARVALVALLGLAAWLAVFHQRPWFLAGTALAIALCWAYNMKPLQLSYRGHGEVLQGLGCGVLLPLIGFYLQHGSLQGFPWAALAPLYLIFHAGNIVTALPDRPADEAGGKHTYPVRHGEPKARRTALMLLALAYAAVVVVNLHLSPVALAIMVVPAALALAGLVATGALQAADAVDFARCRRFITWVSASQAWLLCAWVGALLLDGTR